MNGNGCRTAIREATRRAAQAALLLVPVPIVIVRGWTAVTFPQDDQPWLLLVVLMIAPAVPVAIWWRESVHSALSERVEAIVSSIAAVAGLVTLLVCAAWAGFLLTAPYSGPMAIEATLFLLVMTSLGSAASLFLMLSPLLLDPQFFAPTFRKRAWKTVAYTVPVIIVVALLVGPRFEGVFR